MNKTKDASDEFLILQYLEGDTSLLPELVRRYHKLFCEKAYWVVKDKELAKDVAQESWIIIINQLPSLRNVARFKNWAFRIVYSKAIDTINKQVKESKIIAAEKVLGAGQNEITSEWSLIEKSMLEEIRKLPIEKQDILRLFYTEEYSVSEISSFLNIPIGTVKSRLFKAREKLKSLLK